LFAAVGCADDQSPWEPVLPEPASPTTDGSTANDGPRDAPVRETGAVDVWTPDVDDRFSRGCDRSPHPVALLDTALYIMLDRSTGMQDGVPAGRKWDQVAAGLKAFFAATTDADASSVGIQYFGDTCEPSDYETADEEIAPLPAVAVTLAASL